MSEIFTPYKLGPIELRNRTIRSAAFEGMGKNNAPTEELFNYHRAVARGGIGRAPANCSVSMRDASTARSMSCFRPSVRCRKANGSTRWRS